MSSLILETAARLLRAGKRAALVTIIETTGSTPRKAGTKMLVDEDGHLTGTIGGGCIEADLYALARQAIRTGKLLVHEIDLSARNAEENDMLCGGKLKVLIEPLQGDEQLVLLGAGHISRALHDICRLLDFSITVTDDRPQFANAERFPHAQAVLAAPFEEQFSRLPINAQSSIVIATRGHSHDELCMEQALNTPARYIAMVGSRTKFALFRKNLRDKGYSDEQLSRVHCPAGLSIQAQTPEEIAVSIAAQLIQVRRQAQHEQAQA